MSESKKPEEQSDLDLSKFMSERHERTFREWDAHLSKENPSLDLLLKTHLLIEAKIEELIREFCPIDTAELGRINFSTKLKIALAISASANSTKAAEKFISPLTALRNACAHQLDVEIDKHPEFDLLRKRLGPTLGELFKKLNDRALISAVLLATGRVIASILDISIGLHIELREQQKKYQEFLESHSKEVSSFLEEIMKNKNIVEPPTR